MNIYKNNKTGTLLAIATNRELREVPLDWQHPTDESGEPIPLQSRGLLYTEAEMAELLAEGRTREEIQAEFMPDFSAVPAEKMGVAVYETTTEGTPITTVFPGTREGLFQLLKFCATKCYTFADCQVDIGEWAQILGLMHVLEERACS